MKARTVYVAADGRQFFTEAECLAYESMLGRKEHYRNVLKGYADILPDNDLDDRYCTTREVFDEFLEGLAEYLAEKLNRG